MLITGFRCGYKTSRLEPEAFRLNVGNLTTEYQYAAALRGIPLNKLRRTRSFAMTCLPHRGKPKDCSKRRKAASGIRRGTFSGRKP